MKRIFSILTVLVLWTMLFTPGKCPAQAAAPLYPGSVDAQRTENIEIIGNAEPRVYKIFYSRDDYKKVIEYYAHKMGKTAPNKPSREEALDGPKGSGLEYSAVIFRLPYSGINEADILDPLKMEIASSEGGVVKSNHTWKEFDAAKEKYGYLGRGAFFPDFSAKEKLASCAKKTGSGVSAAADDQKALQAKVQELAKQGRYAEMQQLLSGAKSTTANTSQAMSVSHWDEWIACLDVLDSKAFRAEILIRIK